AALSEQEWGGRVGAGCTALVEDPPGLVGERREDPLVDLPDRRSVVARFERRELAVGERLERRREREAGREGLVEGAEDVVCDLWPDHREQRRRGHRKPEA